MSLEKIELDKFKFSNYSKVSKDLINNTSVSLGSEPLDFLNDLLTVKMDTFMYGMNHVQEVKKSILIPKNWWQHLKQTLFPNSNIKYKYIDVTIKVDCRKCFPEIPALEDSNPYYSVNIIS